MWFDAELANLKLRAPSLARGLLDDIEFWLPHRDFFSDLLNELKLTGTIVEIGVREGHFAKTWLQNRWKGEHYHGIDPRAPDRNTLDWLN